MRAKKVFFAALLGMCSSWCNIQAQELDPPPSMTVGTATEDTPPVGNIPVGTMPAAEVKDIMPVAPKNAESTDTGGTGLSKWITYERDDCCTGSGGAPIMSEYFIRVGPSFPFGGTYFGQTLNTGWMIEGGARGLFFNHAVTAAWTAELGVSNTHNDTTTATTIFLDHNVNRNVTLHSLNRTFANLALGREWYLLSPANSGNCPQVRVGADVGGRWGSAMAQFLEIRHRTDVVEGCFFAIHTDVEIPYEHWTFLVGLRGEYGYTFSNFFAPHGQGGLEETVLLFNFGARY